MVSTTHFCGFPQGSNQEEFHPGKLQRGFHLATKAIRSPKNSARHTLHEAQLRNQLAQVETHANEHFALLSGALRSKEEGQVVSITQAQQLLRNTTNNVRPNSRTSCRPSGQHERPNSSTKAEPKS